MNAKRDRDQLLEEALKHELRATAAPATDACLDAETMAAWMDGGLDSHAIATAEAHASACERCQALLTTVARTMPAAGVAEPRTVRLWRWWMAPLAATAAAVTLWMVVPQPPLDPPAVVPELVSPAARGLAKDAPAEPVAAAPPPQAAEANQLVRERANVAPPRADTTRRPDARTSNELAKREEGTAKLADAAAEGRVAAAAPAAPEAAPPAVAQRAQGAAPPDAQVTARSSPSPDVIWFVGRGGMVMLATDGRTFLRVPFPETVDLTAVRATDESHAVVTAADGRVFQTADGGRTWRLRP